MAKIQHTMCCQRFSNFETSRAGTIHHRPGCAAYRPPSEPPLCDTVWFPMTKSQALTNEHLTKVHFRSLVDSLPAQTLLAYADGSLTNGQTACAVFIPRLDICKSWLLRKNSSVFSAECTGILQELKIIYALEPSPEAAAVLSVSKAAIQAIMSSSTDCPIPEIHNELRCLKS